MIAQTLPEASISKLECTYAMRDGDVQRFLSLHPELVPVLEEIGRVIPDFFGPQTRLELEVLMDPENGQQEELYAVIQTPFEPERALERLRAFDEGWWFDRVPAVAGKLTVTLD